MSEQETLYRKVYNTRCVVCDKKALHSRVYHDRVPYCLDCYCRGKKPDTYLMWLRCTDCSICGKKIPNYLNKCFSCLGKVVVAGMKQCTTCNSLFSISDNRSECSVCRRERYIKKLLLLPNDYRLCPNFDCHNTQRLEKWEYECKDCVKDCVKERKYCMKYLDD